MIDATGSRCLGQQVDCQEEIDEKESKHYAFLTAWVALLYALVQKSGPGKSVF